MCVASAQQSATAFRQTQDLRAEPPRAGGAPGAPGGGQPVNLQQVLHGKIQAAVRKRRGRAAPLAEGGEADGERALGQRMLVGRR